MPHAVPASASGSYKLMKNSNDPSRFTLPPPSVPTLQDRLSPLSASSNAPPQASATTEPSMSFSTFNFRQLSSTPQPQPIMGVPTLLGRMQDGDRNPPQHIEHIRTTPRLPGLVTPVGILNSVRSGGLTLLQRFSGGTLSAEPITSPKLGYEPSALQNIPPPSQNVDRDVIRRENTSLRPQFQTQSEPPGAPEAATITSSSPTPEIKTALGPPPSPPTSANSSPSRVDLPNLERSIQEPVSNQSQREIHDTIMEDVFPESVQPTISSPKDSQAIPSLFKTNPYEGTRFALPKRSSMDAIYAEAQRAQSEWAKHADDLHLAKIVAEQKLQTTTTKPFDQPQSKRPGKPVGTHPNSTPDSFVKHPTSSPSFMSPPPLALPNKHPTQALQITPVSPYSRAADAKTAPLPSTPAQQNTSSVPAVQVVQPAHAILAISAGDIEQKSQSTNRTADARIRNAASAAIMHTSPDSTSLLLTRSFDLSDLNLTTPSLTSPPPVTNSSLIPKNSTTATPLGPPTIKSEESERTAGTKRKAVSPDRTQLNLDKAIGPSPPKIVPMEARKAEPSHGLPQGITKVKAIRGEGRHGLPPVPKSVVAAPEESYNEDGARKRPRVDASLAVSPNISSGYPHYTSLSDTQFASRNSTSRPSPSSSPSLSQVTVDRQKPRSPSPYRDHDKRRENYEPQTLRARDRYASAPGRPLWPINRGRWPAGSKSPPRQTEREAERRPHYAQYRGDDHDSERYPPRSPSPMPRFEHVPYRGYPRQYRDRSPSPSYQDKYDRTSRGRSSSPRRREYYDRRPYGYPEDGWPQPGRQVQRDDRPPSPPPREHYRSPLHESSISSVHARPNLIPARVHQARRSDNYSTPHTYSNLTYEGDNQPASPSRGSYNASAHIATFSSAGIYNRPVSGDRTSPKELPDLSSDPTRANSALDHTSALPSLYDHSDNVQVSSPISPIRLPREHRELTLETRSEHQNNDTFKDFPSAEPAPKSTPGPKTELSRTSDLAPSGISLARRMAGPPPQTLESRISDTRRRPSSNERPPPKRAAPSLMARMN